jgi:hypothetical protein
MIRFTLRCTRDHEFEGWFRSGDDFEKNGTSCPVCGSTDVEKAIMAPQVARKDRGEPASGDKLRVAAADPRHTAMLAALKELREKVTENADYVGDKFAEEARKIHYQEVEPRGIYGEATGEEAKLLLEEGIEFHPLPVLPEDRN